MWELTTCGYYLRGVGSRTIVRGLRYKDSEAEKLELATYDGFLWTVGVTYDPQVLVQSLKG